MTDILEKIRKEVQAVDKPENRINYQQFFKETLAEPVGLRTPVLRQISNRLFREIRSEGREEVLAACEEILNSGIRYGRFFAFEGARKLEKELRESDFARFELWLKKHVGNWAACDHLCGVLGELLTQYPGLSKKRKPWARSGNLWQRRAAAVSLILPARRGLLLEDIIETASILLRDPEDLVQKGYGWMLKEAGARFFDEVSEFVLRHRAEMPRTALRYAIEKWPPQQRTMAMRKTSRWD